MIGPRATYAAVIVSIAVAAGPVRAKRVPKQKTADQVKDAPRPDEASGRRDQPEGDGVLRWTLRGLLFVPKLAVIVLAAPIRASLYAADRLGAAEFIDELFTYEGPLQVFPEAQLESGFGITYGVGARYIDLFGHGEVLRGEFFFGGPIRQVYRLSLRSGDLFDKHDLYAKGELQFLNNSRFFGIGMNELTDIEDVMAPIDPRVDPTAVDTRFDQRIIRSELALTTHWSEHVRTRVSSTLTLREFRQPSARFDDVRDAYDPAAVIGLEDGLSNVYTELAIMLNNRYQESRYVSQVIPSSGWQTEAFAGYALGFGDDPSNYLRYGIDAQRYFRVLFDDRTIVVRGQFEGVTGGLNDVPFVDLPRVGGTRVLRGYVGRRFRDRYMAAATLEYRYPVSQSITSYLFVDAGSVAREPGAFEEARFGTGAGIILHTKEETILRLLGAYGSEGFVFAISLREVSVNPRRSSRR